MNFKSAVNIAMIKKGVDSKEMAERLGCSLANVYNLLSSDSPGLKTMVKIADALDMKVSELIALGE